ncbi:MAG: hypothetical protein Q4G59_08915, partial [Planctomycetia bacterium]|nr:hypothetical protein [Planctomycetia bacterium]
SYSACKNISVSGFWVNSKLFSSQGGNHTVIDSVDDTGGSIGLSPRANPQPQPTLRKIPRTTNDINVSSTAPDQINPVGRTIGTNANQNRAVSNYVNYLIKIGAKDIRVNQQQVNIFSPFPKTHLKSDTFCA